MLHDLFNFQFRCILLIIFYQHTVFCLLIWTRFKCIFSLIVNSSQHFIILINIWLIYHRITFLELLIYLLNYDLNSQILDPLLLVHWWFKWWLLHMFLHYLSTILIWFEIHLNFVFRLVRATLYSLWISCLWDLIMRPWAINI